MRVGFGINLKHKELSLLIDGMFHNSPTPKKIISAWFLNQALETVVSSFKNPSNSREILLKTLLLTALACGNKSVRTHCNQPSRPKLHQKSL